MRRLTAQLALHFTAAARTDGELLSGFLTGAESDFAELVRRHGPMVWGVCRRALPDFADAEDAFQAVFLVLLRRANRLTGYPTVGPWLHRVAVWTAKNVRRRNARRGAKRVPLSDHVAATTTNPDLPLDLDAALLALPDKYRSPVVLCHLLGFSRAEAATRLGCPEGTLSAWLSRGLAKLREKLGGHDPAKVLGVAAVAVPAGLSASVVRAAVASHVSIATTSTVSQIVEGVIQMFWVKTATAASVAMFAVFALGMGVGLSTRQGVGIADAQDNRPGNGPGPSTRTLAPEELDTLIADYEDKIRIVEAHRETAQTRIKASTEKIARLKTNPTAPVEEIAQELSLLAGYQETAASIAVELKKYNDTVAEFKSLKAAKLKAAREKQPPAKAATPPTIGEDIAKLEEKLRAAQAGLDAARAGIRLTEEKITLGKDKGGATPTERLNDQITLTRFKENEAQAALMVLDLKRRIEILKAATPATLDEQIEAVRAELKGALLSLDFAREGVRVFETKIALSKDKADFPTPKEVQKDLDTLARFKESEREAAKLVADLNTKLNTLKRVDKLEDELAETRKAFQLKQEEFDARQRERQVKIDAVLAELKVIRGKSVGYLELTLHGKAREFEFTLRETDAAGKDIGTVVVREPAMLTKLLSRAKNDPAAPKQLRVIADPSIGGTNGYQFLFGLKACESAGFNTITFTGYVPQSFLQELKSDQKGEAPGYKRYDAVERDTATLIKQFEDWMRTW
jgi:RNA polymerase sigma factor (sigma-70 family)